MLRQGILATLVLAIAPLAQAADNGIYLGAGYFLDRKTGRLIAL